MLCVEAFVLMSELRINSVRKRIVDEHEELLHHESAKGVLLASAIILATFGTAAVLMPEDPTGDFSADFEITEVEVEDMDIRGVEASQQELVFIQDYEITNPNLLEADFVGTSYRVEVDGEPVRESYVDGTSTVDSGQNEMLAFETSAPVHEFEGFQEITVEGKKLFEVGNEEFEEYYRHSFTTFLP